MGFIGLMEVEVMPVFLIKVIRERQFRLQTPKWLGRSSARAATHLSKRRPAVSATIYTKKISAQLALDLQKHQAQYPAIEVKPIAGFHDRFLLLDGDTLYHLGASLKDLGTQCFAFSRLDSFAAELRQQLPPSK
jgi:hypothetical protein